MFWPTQSRITNINYELGSEITTYNWPFAKTTEASSKIAELSLFNALLFMIMLAYLSIALLLCALNIPEALLPAVPLPNTT